MPEKTTRKRATAAKRAGRAPTTQAGEYVREEVEHVRRGKHGARSTKQAIAIGLSKARRASVMGLEERVWQPAIRLSLNEMSAGLWLQCNVEDAAAFDSFRLGIEVLLQTNRQRFVPPRIGVVVLVAFEIDLSGQWLVLRMCHRHVDMTRAGERPE